MPVCVTQTEPNHFTLRLIVVSACTRMLHGCIEIHCLDFSFSYGFVV